MATKVLMEALSPTMEEGRLVKWLKNEGDQIKNGDVLAEVETDKAVMELVARGDGVLRKRLANEGDAAPVGALLGVVAAPDEDITALVKSALQRQPRLTPPRRQLESRRMLATLSRKRRNSRELHRFRLHPDSRRVRHQRRHRNASGAVTSASTLPRTTPKPAQQATANPHQRVGRALPHSPAAWLPSVALTSDPFAAPVLVAASSSATLSRLR